MLNHDLRQVIKHWNYIAPFVSYPKNDKQFNTLVDWLDKLLEVVGKDESHSLMNLVDVISYFIEDYERKRYQREQKTPRGVDALKFLMESHHLNQADLPELGSQGVVSEILRGKRHLNLRQVKFLSKRFGVDPSTFIDDE